MFLLHVWLSQRGIRSGKLYRSGVRVAGACAALTRPRPSVRHLPPFRQPFTYYFIPPTTATTTTTPTVHQIIIPLINTHMCTRRVYNAYVNIEFSAITRYNFFLHSICCSCIYRYEFYILLADHRVKINVLLRNSCLTFTAEIIRGSKVG